MSILDTDTAVVEALSQALETMAFLDVGPLSEPMDPPHCGLRAGIDFAGPVRGRFEVAAGADFASLLAQNIAGLSAPTDQQIADAMRELANVTCGLILPLLASAETDLFDVSVPWTEAFAEVEQWSRFATRPGAVVTDAESFPVALVLTVSNPSE